MLKLLIISLLCVWPCPPVFALDAQSLGVIVNENDPLSVLIGGYYREKRAIPEKNIIRVRFPYDHTGLDAKLFVKIKAEVEKKTPDTVQAWALTWAKPYKVGCLSITTAFAVGYDESWCIKKQACEPTKVSPYFNTDSITPWTDFRLRPTMALAALDFADAKALIDRGVASDGSFPSGTAYLVNTSDQARNVRSVFFPEIKQRLRGFLRLREVNWDYIDYAQDVLFYFTGLHDVPKIKSNRYLPGAVADHLTSSGGQLTGSSQMSVLRWLEAGVTGSYGAVSEPCNVLGKFPHPGIMMWRYYQGETLIEAYWKSVAMPAQGIFVGEPLAAPFRRPSIRQPAS